jgi:cytochrome c oxidase assembly protein subunit 15
MIEVTESRMSHTDWVRLWLIVVTAMVFVMVSVGGATRLTGSGLSITEWQPILGIIPPLTDADWQAAFAKYREIPQFSIVNSSMTLGEFKFIYWWEWSHRLLGRLIGVVVALPLAWFSWHRQLSARLGRQLFALFLLGGLQGVVGWYMVQSGLTDRVSVSQYRLALHLTLAMLILAALVWVVTSIEEPPPATTGTITTTQRRVAVGIGVLLLLQIAAGALVASTKAGFTFNTWPLMDGQLVPVGLYDHDPWWQAGLEDLMTVQFNHRIIAYALVGIAIWHAIATTRASSLSPATASAKVLAMAIVAQAALGIWTLLQVVPIPLGLAHQFAAAGLVSLAAWHLRRVFRARASA